MNGHAYLPSHDLIPPLLCTNGTLGNPTKVSMSFPTKSHMA